MRPDKYSGYGEIRLQLGRPPDLARLNTSASAREQIAAHRVTEATGHGHAFKEHRASSEEVSQRAADGTCARDGVQRYTPKDATRFRSDEALIAAVAAGWAAPETVRQRFDGERRYTAALAGGASEHDLRTVARQIKIYHYGSVERALGPEWRKHVEGYTKASAGRDESHFDRNSEIITVWRMTHDGRWYVETCFPRPGD